MEMVFAAILGAATLAIVLLHRQQQKHERLITQLRAEIAAQKLAHIGTEATTLADPEPGPDPVRRKRHLRLITGGAIASLGALWQNQRPVVVAGTTATAVAVTAAVIIGTRINSSAPGAEPERAAPPAPPTASAQPQPPGSEPSTAPPSDGGATAPPGGPPLPTWTASPDPVASPMGAPAPGPTATPAPTIAPAPGATGGGGGDSAPPTAPPAPATPEAEDEDEHDGRCLRIRPVPHLAAAACLLGQR